LLEKEKEDASVDDEEVVEVVVDNKECKSFVAIAELRD
jgi:hypothetical protein